MLDDLFMDGLRLVVCGTAAGRASALVGRYYAGPGNKFWRTLAEVGLTPRRLEPSEYGLLPNYGIGLTDLVKAQFGGDHEITFALRSRAILHAKIERHQPRVFCFNGKRAAKEFYGVDEVSFGIQPALIGRTRVFVAPSTSGAANGSWDHEAWRQLAGQVLGDQTAT
jgi:TDG/mug DNA glycosylase family protein